MNDDIRKYDFVDALRGYAILLVVLVHSTQTVAPSSKWLQMFSEAGARGVQLFFIASALTLCLSWEARRSHEQSPLRNFYIRRFFRIAPMFYVAMIFYLLLDGLSPRYWAPNGVEWWSVALTALFLNGLHPESITAVVPGGWSIAVEMNFYLVLPFLLRWIRNLKSAVAFVLFSLVLDRVARLVFGALYAGCCSAQQEYLVEGFSYLNFFGQLPVFALGLCAYFLFVKGSSLKRVAIYGSAFVVLFIVVLSIIPSRSAIPRLLENRAGMGVIFAVFALTLSVYPVKLLVNKIITFLGRISFSMYLSHFAVLHFFSKLGFSAWLKDWFGHGDLASLAHFGVVVTVATAISYVFYTTVERGGIALGKRLITRLERGSTAEVMLGPSR